MSGILRGLYETHLEVSRLERSVDYYQSLGLVVDTIDWHRRAAFMHLYGEREYMIGLWEKETVHPRHFAFRIDESDVDRMLPFLIDRGIVPAFGFTEVMVSPRSPIAQLYFHDANGNELELVAKLSQPPRPDIAVRWISLSEWRALASSLSADPTDFKADRRLAP